MVARVQTVAFAGIEVLAVDAQVTIASGLPAFQMVRSIITRVITDQPLTARN